MKTVPARSTARHLHLVRAAQCAGEAFAYAAEEAPTRERFGWQLATWLGIGAVAAAGLFAAF